MRYQSNYEGKQQYTKDCLEPMFVGLGNGWESVEYVIENAREKVILTNANEDKSFDVDVTCDSILALANDVMRAYLNKVTY